MPSLPAVTRTSTTSRAALALAAAWTICCSTSEPASPTAAIDGGFEDATTYPKGDASSPSGVDAGPSDDASVVTPPSTACVTYCNALQSTCSADYPQFGSTTACLNACAFYPPGTADGPENEGDSLKCRAFHLAGGSGHCLHAGPYGYGGCGFMCENFCRLAMAWCGSSKGGAPFPSLASCETTCELWPWVPNGPDGAAAYRATTPDSGNTLDCREVQLTKSLESAAARDTYCPLAADDSLPCR